MSIMSKNIYVVNRIALFAALNLLKNFKPCNKHFYFLAKKIGIFTKNIPVVRFVSQ